MKILPATSKLVHRQVVIQLLSGNEASLSWGKTEGEAIEHSKLFPGLVYKDSDDGGIQLNATAISDNIELSIVLRQYEPINYPLGAVSYTHLTLPTTSRV